MEAVPHPSRFLKGGITPPITDPHSSQELEPLLLSPRVGPPCASRPPRSHFGAARSKPQPRPESGAHPPSLTPLPPPYILNYCSLSVYVSVRASAACAVWRGRGES